MKLNDFLKLIAFLFAAKAVFGLIYILLGWQATMGGMIIPSWLVVVAVATDALLASVALKLVKK